MRFAFIYNRSCGAPESTAYGVWFWIYPTNSGFQWQKVQFKIPGRLKHVTINLVGGFNPIEKYESKRKTSPGSDENKKIFETTT